MPKPAVSPRKSPGRKVAPVQKAAATRGTLSRARAKKAIASAKPKAKARK